jgi:hypothetical protein
LMGLHCSRRVHFRERCRSIRTQLTKIIILNVGLYKVGGLDLSRRDLDRDLDAKKSQSRQSRFSRQFEKRHLDSRDFLDSSKTKSRQSRLL